MERELGHPRRRIFLFGSILALFLATPASGEGFGRDSGMDRRVAGSNRLRNILHVLEFIQKIPPLPEDHFNDLPAIRETFQPRTSLALCRIKAKSTPPEKALARKAASLIQDPPPLQLVGFRPLKKWSPSGSPVDLHNFIGDSGEEKLYQKWSRVSGQKPAVRLAMAPVQNEGPLPELPPTKAILPEPDEVAHPPAERVISPPPHSSFFGNSRAREGVPPVPQILHPRLPQLPVPVEKLPITTAAPFSSRPLETLSIKLEPTVDPLSRPPNPEGSGNGPELLIFAAGEEITVHSRNIPLASLVERLCRERNLKLLALREIPTIPLTLNLNRMTLPAILEALGQSTATQLTLRDETLFIF